MRAATDLRVVPEPKVTNVYLTSGRRLRVLDDPREISSMLLSDNNSRLCRYHR